MLFLILLLFVNRRTAECSNNDRAEGSCLHWKKSIGPVVAPIRVTATKSDRMFWH